MFGLLSLSSYLLPSWLSVCLTTVSTAKLLLSVIYCELDIGSAACPEFQLTCWLSPTLAMKEEPKSGCDGITPNLPPSPSLIVFKFKSSSRLPPDAFHPKIPNALCFFVDSPSRGPDTPPFTKGDLAPMAAARLPEASPPEPKPNIDGAVAALALYPLALVVKMSSPTFT